MLEDGDGLEFCSYIRQQSNVRFIFLTAMDQEIDVVMGYEVGADDYITKPFSLTVLLSKVNAIFKRLNGDANVKLESDQVCVLLNEMRVLVGENIYNLPKMN